MGWPVLYLWWFPLLLSTNGATAAALSLPPAEELVQVDRDERGGEDTATEHCSKSCFQWDFLSAEFWIYNAYVNNHEFYLRSVVKSGLLLFSAIVNHPLALHRWNLHRFLDWGQAGPLFNLQYKHTYEMHPSELASPTDRCNTFSIRYLCVAL